MGQFESKDLTRITNAFLLSKIRLKPSYLPKESRNLVTIVKISTYGIVHKGDQTENGIVAQFLHSFLPRLVMGEHLDNLEQIDMAEIVAKLFHPRNGITSQLNSQRIDTIVQLLRTPRTGLSEKVGIIFRGLEFRLLENVVQFESLLEHKHFLIVRL